MSDHDALLAAIRADPEEDTPRLALADYLDEAGGDRNAAHAEWVRLTCGVPRKERHRRLAGEPSWLLANAHRLWPAMHAAARDPHRVTPRPGERRVQVRLLRGEVRLRVPLLMRPTPASVVGLVGGRGVVGEAWVTFFGASALAVAAASDEPHAEIRFTSVPSLPSFHPSGSLVGRKLFERWGLGGVWDALPGARHHRPGKGGDPHKVAQSFPGVCAALTAWARAEAAGTFMGHRVPDEDT